MSLKKAIINCDINKNKIKLVLMFCYNSIGRLRDCRIFYLKKKYYKNEYKNAKMGY